MAKSSGFDLSAVLGDVSRLDTGTNADREQIEYIDIDLIDNDPKNFYELNGLEELAANIQLCGLQQPVRVRDGEPGRVVIVSGHRRRAALQKLIAEGMDQFRAVPCIRERADGSPAFQELRLIYANSDTRKLTSADQARQAERVEMLLYQLKEEGYEFPGRMRDHVAEACKLSKTKLARLKVIRENLIPELANAYAENVLKESTAYTLAQHSAGIQKLVLRYKGKKDMQYWAEWSVKDAAEKIEKVIGRACKKKGGTCTHHEAMLTKLFDGSYSYKPCDRACCDKCDQLAKCKSACPLLAEKVKKLKADAREESRQERQAKEAKEAPAILKIQNIWMRFGYARTRAGKSIQDAFKAMDRYFSKSDSEKWESQENATAKFTPESSLPFGYSYSLRDAEKLCAVANLFDCSVDFLLCRTDDPRRNVPVDGETGWEQNKAYPKGCWIAALFQINEGEPTRKIIYVTHSGSLVFNQKSMQPVGMEPLAWVKLPGVPKT